LHQLGIHDGEKRVRAAVANDPIHIAEYLERNGLECGLADAPSRAVNFELVDTRTRWIPSFEFVDDKGRKKPGSVFLSSEKI
jgi:hypothetical protein